MNGDASEEGIVLAGELAQQVAAGGGTRAGVQAFYAELEANGDGSVPVDELKDGIPDQCSFGHSPPAS
jgi:hypothetical protein